MEKDKKNYNTTTSKPVYHAVKNPKVDHANIKRLSPKSQVNQNPQHHSENVQDTAVANLNKKFENFLFERHIQNKITNQVVESLQKKSDKSGIEFEVLSEVFKRGLSAWNPYICKNATQEQWAFARVNSFISGGKAVELDSDLAEGSFKTKETSEKQSTDPNNPMSRLDGTKQGAKTFKKGTPGQNEETEYLGERLIHAKYNGNPDPCWSNTGEKRVQKGTKIKGGKVVPNCVPVNEASEYGCPLIDEEVWDKPNPVQKAGKSKKLSPAQKAKAKARAKAAGRPYPNMVDNIAVAKEETELSEKSAAWQRKEGKNPKGGLNEKGRKSYERENPGSDLKPPQPHGGPRKRSFCARMGGMPGPLKDKNGKPTRKALALRKWHCGKKGK